MTTRRAHIEIAPVERETFIDENGDEWVQGLPTYFLRLRASNGRILAHSEVYASKSNAKRAASAWLVAMSDLEWADVCEVTE